MNSCSRWMQLVLIVAGVAVCLFLTMSVAAQVQTQTTTSSGPATREVKVERAEVVDVAGKDLVLKMQDGSLRHIANVPESARATVDGKEIGIHDVKVGMILEKTITTTTTPKVITTVKSVTGKVWHVNPPTSVILTLEDGTNQQFKIPKGQKFNIDGQMVDAWGLKVGMKVAATKVTEVPEIESETQHKLTGSMPPPPPADSPILVAQGAPAPAPAPAAEAPAKLPKTGSPIPLFGLLGLVSLVSSLGLRAYRRLA